MKKFHYDSAFYSPVSLSHGHVYNVLSSAICKKQEDSLILMEDKVDIGQQITKGMCN